MRIKLSYKNVVYWVQRGFEYKAIGDRLMVHPSTVRNMVQSDVYLRNRYSEEQRKKAVILMARKQQLNIF